MFSRFINALEESAILLLLVAMIMLVFIETIMRFVFNAGFLWAQELTLHLSAWFVLFGASYGLKKGAHISVEVFIQLLPPIPRKAVMLLAIALCLLYCGLFMYGAWVYLGKMYAIGLEMEDLPILKWQAHSILFVGMLLLAVRLLELLWKVITNQAEDFTAGIQPCAGTLDIHKSGDKQA